MVVGVLSQNKNELLKECAKILQSSKVSKWYKKHLESEPQYETINELAFGVFQEELTVREALSIALIVGVQWNIKFEGVK